MGFINRSFVSFIALVGVAPLVDSRSLPLRRTFIPRQASPGFTCSYPAEWQNCNDAKNRGCWLRHSDGREFNITTDYETNTPEGIERKYDIELTEEAISPDGAEKTLAKLINHKYPGQLIEACWGDTVVINVKNSLPKNGTTMHWHGIRQLGSNEMDGVNGVTQCPTSNGDTFQYRFRLTQYGHSWYHSHYSSQYSDGVAGPLLIHGPHSENWDEEWSPIIVTDWLHKSAFEAFGKEIGQGTFPQADSILVNGTGRYLNGGDYFKQKFEAGKRYLIRIINGSTGLHFHFSIDSHTMTVVSADFVPIKAYNTTSLSVGIGQRYSVIVEAKPDTPSSNGKYWLRTEYDTNPRDGCNFPLTGDTPNGTPEIQKTGIISYTNATGGENDLPTSTGSGIAPGCSDESASHKLEPMVPWTITPPQNNPDNYTFEAGLDQTNKNVWHKAFQRWSITDTPLWLNFSDPVLLNLDNTTWNPEYAIVDYDYKNPAEFVYMLITSGNNPSKPGKVNKLGVPHPIHLHGHDFAIIGQSSNKWDASNHEPFNTINPPRRDVAMLPAGGYLAIAFKPDNPGAWILHCHIAWHAGSGLALNVLERQSEIASHIGSLDPIKQGCNKWNSWLANNPDKFNPARDQEDSGI